VSDLEEQELHEQRGLERPTAREDASAAAHDLGRRATEELPDRVGVCFNAVARKLIPWSQRFQSLRQDSFRGDWNARAGVGSVGFRTSIVFGAPSDSIELPRDQFIRRDETRSPGAVPQSRADAGCINSGGRALGQPGACRRELELDAIG
jgi:hypothetical protein